MTGRLRTYAPGKVNLCLLVGEPRADGYHPLASVFQAVDLADELTLEPAPAGATADEVVCAGVEGPNLADRALAAYREASGWDGPPVRITIVKRVPVAAGMGGGSGDAAAALRLAAHAAGRPDDPLIARIAPTLGADVPFALHGGRALVTGIGEHVEALPPGPPAALVVVPAPTALSTPAVYREADRLAGVGGPNRADGGPDRADGGPDRPDGASARDEHGTGRSTPAAGPVEAGLRSAVLLAAAEQGLRDRLAMGGAPPAVNDLEPAALSLDPGIRRALDDLAAAGAQTPIVSGSGPTTFGRFEDPEEAEAVARRLEAAHPGTVVARPAPAGLTAVTVLP